MNESSKNARKEMTVACPVTGNDNCKEPSCRDGCYLLSLRRDGWSDAEIADLIDEVSDVE